MEKDFDGWNGRKKHLQSSAFTDFVHEREVWWCSLGLNIGDEQDGKNDLYERPVIILKKFNASVVLVVPCTSKRKKGPYYLPLVREGKSYAAIISQLRLVSTKRLIRKIYTMDNAAFSLLQDVICSMIKHRPPRKRGPRRPHGHL